MKRRLSLAGVETIRSVRLSAISQVLEAQAIQRPTEAEFRVSIVDVARMSGVPLYAVRRMGVEFFASIKVPGRVVGYDRGEFYVADDEATAKRRAAAGSSFPPLDQPIDPLARADTIGNLPGYHDGETWIPGGL